MITHHSSLSLKQLDGQNGHIAILHGFPIAGGVQFSRGRVDAINDFQSRHGTGKTRIARPIGGVSPRSVIDRIVVKIPIQSRSTVPIIPSQSRHAERILLVWKLGRIFLKQDLTISGFDESIPERMLDRLAVFILQKFRCRPFIGNGFSQTHARITMMKGKTALIVQTSCDLFQKDVECMRHFVEGCQFQNDKPRMIIMGKMQFQFHTMRTRTESRDSKK
mmetsp:Transcript_32569/g.67921  ORF Transcript_32569/g.67921 Transcript_32569/m.67921 type:complete len:220 (+) Transcript_32569:1332-1991(+)